MAKRRAVSDFPIAQLCALIATGSSLRKACSKLKLHSNTALQHIQRSPALMEQYRHARLQQADFYADEIVHITDTERDPNRARVRVDARKWIASKMLPRVYGDAPAQTNVNVQNNVVVMSEDEQRKYQTRLKALRDSAQDTQSSVLPIEDKPS